MNILVTGGAGYIGSHTILELQKAGHDTTIIDNLSNSKAEAIKRVSQLAGKQIRLIVGDLLNEDTIETLFRENKFDAVIHFAAMKAVGESIEKPLEYYRNNLISTMNLLSAMKRHAVTRLIYSSSATVYGEPKKIPITEDFPTTAINPYGWTKYMNEQIIRDVAATGAIQAVLLRYFNPVGAHESGIIGEDPNGIPNNLMPRIIDAAAGKLDELTIYGDDYATPDGTCIRDYIHVCDLAHGHLLAVDRLMGIQKGVEVYNLGTGRGTSVKEMISTFERVNNLKLKCRIIERRPGDAPEVYADVGKAFRELGFKAELSVDRMCADSWRWYKNNPQGYQ